MFEAFQGRIDHFLHCGIIWAYGTPEQIPYEEHYPRHPITNHGRHKVEIETFLFEKFRREGFPATVIHPGHICGRKRLPIDPQGSINNLEIYRRLATGQEILMPNESAIIHPAHGDDVARRYELATHAIYCELNRLRLRSNQGGPCR